MNHDTTDHPLWKESEEESEYDPADNSDLGYSQRKLDKEDEN